MGQKYSHYKKFVGYSLEIWKTANTPGHLLWRNENLSSHRPLSTAAEFVVAKTRRQPGCPSVSEHAIY